MNKNTYDYQKSEDGHVYFFVSNGIHGQVNKAVLISRIEDPELNPGTRKYGLPENW